MLKNNRQENHQVPAITPESEAEAKFSELGISPSILEALQKLKLDVPTPIQRKAIPIAIAGQDLIGVAQTGTGKTFAFGIPMLQNLAISKGQGLILAPTRELALQVEESLKTIGKFFGLRTAILIGGESLDRQLFMIRKKPHIIVATPGRMIDHLKRHTVKLDQVKVLVLDEADMMLDMGFAPQVEEILKQVPKDRQTMLFSATMPAAIVKLAAKYMKLPVSIETAPPGTTAELVDQEIYIIKGEDRLFHLEKVLDKYAGSVLVFVRTKHGVKTVTAKLQALGHKAVEIHSNLSLARRRAALAGFKDKSQRIMVATDVAARGLDVSGIEVVVNYNLPDNCEDYVHRIGRTARAGRQGKAISFATSDQRREIKTIERLINKNLPITELIKFEKPAGYVPPREPVRPVRPVRLVRPSRPSMRPQPRSFGRPSMRPSMRPAVRPDANEFTRYTEIPSTRPTNRPSSRPATRPSATHSSAFPTKVWSSYKSGYRSEDKPEAKVESRFNSRPARKPTNKPGNKFSNRFGQSKNKYSPSRVRNY